MQTPPPMATNGSGVPLQSVWLMGIHPPLTQTPPPIAANGSVPMHPVVAGAVGVGDGAGSGFVIMPGGYQPPLKHVPPPIAANGSGVVHDVGAGGGGGGGGVGVGPGVGGGVPGGACICQPPFTQ